MKDCKNVYQETTAYLSWWNPERNTYTAEENRNVALHTELKIFNQLGYEEKSILRKKYKNQEYKEANKPKTKDILQCSDKWIEIVDTIINEVI